MSAGDRLRAGFLLPWFKGDWNRISIGRYAASIELALHQQVEYFRILGTHYNAPTTIRRRFPGEADYRALPRRWGGDADLIHCVDTWQAIHWKRFPRQPFVATIHDAIPRQTIKLRGARSAIQLTTFWRGYRAARHATAVITPSEHTRAELIGLVDIAPDRVVAVPVIVPDHFTPVDEPGDPSEPGRPAILSVGTAETYKHLPLLLEALAQPELSGVQLVRVGGSLRPEHWRLAGSLGIRNRVVELGSIDEAALVQAYRSATVLAQPSLMEGFGMPVAEAMACGLPVVVSSGGALPEVVGDAGRVVQLSSFEPNVVPPDDARAFARALAEVIEDRELRRRMRSAGIERVREFRPGRVGPRVLEVYRRAIELHRS